MNKTYVLITAAKNEERYIPNTLQSVVNQTYVPEAWLIISDGSTDQTDELVRQYTSRYDFIHLLRLDNIGDRSFSSKAFALNTAYDNIKHSRFDFVGILDADISLPDYYYEELLMRFEMRP